MIYGNPLLLIYIVFHTPASIVSDALLYLMEAKFWQS